MTTSHEELVKLEALAKKATPGPWRSHDHNSMAQVGENPANWVGYAWVGHGGTTNGNFDAKIADLDARKDGSPAWREQAHRNAAYIAAASPDVILSLVERVKECETDLNEMTESRDYHYKAFRKLMDDKARLEGALKPHACGCPGACERKRNNAYAEPDMCCVAHDALAPDSK